MKTCVLRVSAAAALLAASAAQAGLVGATYTASTSGGDVSTGFNSTFTDPSNPVACIASPSCPSGGFRVVFAFADISPTQATISFVFNGTGTNGTSSWSLSLGNFHTLDGSVVTDIVYRAGTGDMRFGSFGQISWDGTTAVFGGAPQFIAPGLGSFYSAHQRAFVFDVTLAPPAVEPNGTVPEPASLALAGLALAGLGLARRRR